jgi:hypothetical protein
LINRPECRRSYTASAITTANADPESSRIVFAPPYFTGQVKIPSAAQRKHYRSQRVVNLRFRYSQLRMINAYTCKALICISHTLGSVGMNTFRAAQSISGAPFPSGAATAPLGQLSPLAWGQIHSSPSRSCELTNSSRCRFPNPHRLNLFLSHQAPVSLQQLRRLQIRFCVAGRLQARPRPLDSRQSDHLRHARPSIRRVRVPVEVN